ncbi:hypothetical protein BDV96DRAFT_645814 [Lophiotrema nucula]|uniref:Pal1 cell morphology protein-domain-containing protein n=1 Tax=Lophiotrema nucula TaxID=690887 RepID=A0A6A5Z965_9PLEO|nr:hypothetical protein BDV96DRAFT_645814 [Lophiotrema nucula]
MATRVENFLKVPQPLPKQALGLPYEDYEARQARKRISDCYQSVASCSSRSSFNTTATGSTSHSRKASTGTTSSSKPRSHEERLTNSKVRYATRAALEPGFVPETDGRDNTPRKLGRAVEYYSDDGKPPIPKHIVDEFNRRWHKDYESNNTDRTVPDFSSKSEQRRYRSVVKGDPDVTKMLTHVEQYQRSYGSEGSQPPMYREDSERRPVRMMEQAMAHVRSDFDWDSSDADSEVDVELKKQKVLRKSILRRLPVAH